MIKYDLTTNLEPKTTNQEQPMPSTPPQILFLDPFSGVSGDMWVGALLDLGVDLAQLSHELSKLNLAGYQLGSRRVFRGAMSALKFDVTIDGEQQKEFDAPPLPLALSSDHAHDHGHDHGAHSHGHEHGGAGVSAKNARRNFSQIKTLIKASTLSERVKSGSIAAFQKLAEAEGRIHNMPPDEVSFHEVGALDSIIDFVAVCAGLEILGIDEVWCGPLALGRGGFVQCDHGLMPVPAPATLELVKGMPLRDTPVEKELTTPTGAALVAALSVRFCAASEMTVKKIGYGAGSRERQSVPNVLRAMLGHAADSSGGERDEIVEIRANIDDATPETLGFLLEKLFDSAALDAFFTPIQMKKNRPATLLTVLCETEAFEPLSNLILAESSSFGLRHETLQRRKLAREIVTVETRYGPVRVKLGRLNGKLVSVHPEYDDCRRLALERNVPIKEIMRLAQQICAPIAST